MENKITYKEFAARLPGNARIVVKADHGKHIYNHYTANEFLKAFHSTTGLDPAVAIMEGCTFEINFNKLSNKENRLQEQNRRLFN